MNSLRSASIRALHLRKSCLIGYCTRGMAFNTDLSINHHTSSSTMKIKFFPIITCTNRRAFCKNFSLHNNNTVEDSQAKNGEEVETNSDYFACLASVVDSCEKSENQDALFSLLKELLDKKDMESLKMVYFMLMKENLVKQSMSFTLTSETLFGLIYETNQCKKFGETIHQTSEVFDYLKRLSNTDNKLKKSVTKQKIDIALELLKQIRKYKELKLVIKILSKELPTITGLKRAEWLTILAKAIEKSKLNSNVKLTYSQIFSYIDTYTKTKDPSTIYDFLCTRGSLSSLSNGTSPLGIGSIVSPMLAKPMKQIDADFLTKLKNEGESQIICERKYDGERLLLHFDASTNQVLSFSRNRKATDLLKHYPVEKESLMQSILSQNNKRSFILDCEYIICDKDSGKVASFQEFQNRAKLASSMNPLIRAFDILFLDDQSLTNSPLQHRRNILEDIVSNIDNSVLKMSEAKVFDIHSTDLEKIVDDIYDTMNESLASNCEGLIIKCLSSSYEFGKRGWYKLKKEYIKEGLYDTMDLIVLGAKKGNGKRSGVFGSFLMGAIDTKTGKICTVCFVGSGLSNKLLELLTNESLKHYIPTPLISDERDLESKYGVVVPKSAFKSIDCWFVPQLVCEVSGADITKSNATSSGLGIRFPVFVKTREDKTPEMATTLEDLQEMRKAQQSKILPSIDEP
ncbi:hypothetical protein C9374_011082 [Naegleria lovaniensis]|uniref:DNA ligase 1 n=1 Tax=Naegleria lovaniensis TaxID=51637 RepID=A0AA88GEZ6_NAELO|nr:uncharacterized protein C9374_011082 [Naegleria lovaniensis]KAG2374245.1 hypothetical protein C9374_011082 [Naegleria lovaniensis]